jgi:hypothetical protein
MFGHGYLSDRVIVTSNFIRRVREGELDFIVQVIYSHKPNPKHIPQSVHVLKLFSLSS